MTEILFKAKQGVPVTQTSYWIIDHTDMTLTAFQHRKNEVDMLDASPLYSGYLVQDKNCGGFNG